MSKPDFKAMARQIVSAFAQNDVPGNDSLPGLRKIVSDALQSTFEAGEKAGAAAERERCAEIAKAQREEYERFRLAGVIPVQQAVMCELTANQIAAAIRSQKP